MGIEEFANVKRIERLLDKYWQGTSSLEEEEVLRNYFNSEKVAEHLLYVKPMFQMLKMKQQPHVSDGFDQIVQTKLSMGFTSESMVRKKANNWWKVAAVITVLLVGTYTITSLIDQPVQDISMEDSFDTPEEAYAQFKQSLMLVSTKLNSGNEYMEGLNKLNAGAKVYNNQKTEEKDKK